MKIFEYNLDEISTPTGHIFMRFGFKKTGSGKLDDEGKPETYLVGWAGFGQSPAQVRYGNARVKFDALTSASDLVHAVKEVLGDTEFGKVFISAKTLEVVPIDGAPPYLSKFFSWVDREGGERIKLWEKPEAWEPEKKDDKVEIKGRKRKINPMLGKQVRDRGEPVGTKKTVTFTVGSRFYREIQNNLPNVMKYRGPNGTFVMPNEIFATFKKQAEAKFPFADIKVQNRVATGESIPGTFVDPSDDARQQAKAVMQKDADAAVVGRAKMGITDVDEGSDKSAHDCGIVDGYYGRRPDPHKYEMGQRIKLTDPKEVNEYMMGYKDDSAGSKDYEEDIDNGITSSSQPDHEASMAKGELYNVVKNAKELFHMIQDGENLEGWVASKITRAADYINTVHDYMMYEKQYNESMNEVAKWRKHPSARSENPHWDPPDERDDPDHYTPKYTSKGDTPPRQGSLSSRSPLRKGDISQSGPRKGLPLKSHQGRLKNQIKASLAGNESMNERSTSEKQARTMAAAAHDPKFAKKVGIKTSVAKEFNKADKGTKRLSNAMKKEDVTDEGGPASRSLCRSKKPDSALGASNLASCVSQGLRAHKSGRADYVNGKQLRVGGKKVKGKAHGGPLPDYS